MSRQSIPRFSRLAIAVGVGCAAGFQVPAWSQSSDTEVDDTVVVTGSRIRRDTFDSVSPVQIVTRDEVTIAGFTSTTEALQGTAVTTGAAQINNAFGGFVTDGGPGANTLSLRGLGAGRTLVLINGRRVAPAGTRGAVGSADLNVLPNAIIDHIEVLKDGASSIYGSDAIAGVVNVVTKSNVEGLTLEAQFNYPLDGGGQQGRVSMVGGLSGERWSLGGSLEFYDRNELTLGQRDWTLCNTDNLVNPATGQRLDFIDPRTGAPKCYPITGTGSNGVTINTIGTQSVTLANAATLGLIGPVVGAPGSSGTTFNRWRPNSAVTTGFVGFEGVGGGSNNLNVRDTFEPRMYNRSIISPAEHTTAFLEGTYQLEGLGDAELYFEMLATRRESAQTGYRQLSLDYRVGSPLIPAALAFSRFGPDQGTSGGQPVGVRAFIGFGNDRSEQTVDYLKPMVGLAGGIGSDWRYDLNLTVSRADSEYLQESFLTDKLTFAGNAVAAPGGLDASLVRNGLTCAVNLTNPAERCILYPALSTAVIGGTLPQNFVDYVWRDVIGSTQYDEDIVSAAFDGPLATLPAGDVQAVFGVEYRDVEIDDTPDPNSISSNLYNLTSATPTRGKDNVAEIYSEVEVPLLADKPGANDLRLNASWRYTDYDSYGSDDTYKLGLMWSPIDWGSLRYTRGTSFRAPALFEQYQGPTSGFLSQALDPCNNYGVNPNPIRRGNCAAELPGNPTFVATSGIRVFSEGGAAAGLRAETSDNVTYGLILQPPLGERGDLSIAIDYFDVEINNGVDQAGGNNILARCYDDPQFRAGGAFCRLVTRNSATAALTVSNAHTNIATQLAEGIDYTFRYEREVGPGSLLLNFQATHYKTQASKLFADEQLDQLNGSVNNPENIATVDFTYSFGNWRVRYGVDWIDDMDSTEYLELNPATSVFDFAVGDYQEHHASVRYTNDDWQWTFGIRNLFDEKPPTISQGFYSRTGNAPMYSGYDFFGREAFVQMAKEF